MKRLTKPSAILITSLFATTIHAEKKLEEYTLNDLIGACEQALSTKGDPLPYVGEILSRSRFQLGKRNQQRGADCLSEVYSSTYRYSNGKFVSDDALAMDATIAAITKKKTERYRLEFAKALIAACTNKYKTDRFAALTAPACAEIFISYGLPED